jgi:uncharacterized ion transporter superfamily protein YfcC
MSFGADYYHSKFEIKNEEEERKKRRGFKRYTWKDYVILVMIILVGIGLLYGIVVLYQYYPKVTIIIVGICGFLVYVTVWVVLGMIYSKRTFHKDNRTSNYLVRVLKPGKQDSTYLKKKTKRKNIV